MATLLRRFPGSAKRRSAPPATVLAVALAVLSARPARATDADLYGPIAQITLDAIYAGSMVPGASGGITFPDGSQWLGATGYTDWARTQPLLPTDQFRIASETKTFTSTLILQLVGQGVLSLTDTINKWCPGLNIPDGNTITILQLLTMRTNIPHDPGQDVLDTYYSTQGQIPYTPAQYVMSSNSEPRVKVAPGQYSYSDMNYDILGLIAEAATGRDLGAMITQQLIQPAGLSTTAFLPPGSNAWTAPHSNGYFIENGTVINFTNWAPTFWADGGMVSTPADELRWIHELMTNQSGLLTPAMFAMRMATLPTVPIALAVDYGMGLTVVRSGMTGDRLIGHNGANEGYQSDMWHADGSGLDIVVDQNLGPGRPGAPGSGQSMPTPTSSMMLLEYDLAQAMAANGSCDGGTCSGVNVRLTPLTLGGAALLVQPTGLVTTIPIRLPSGATGTATNVAPTLAFYGNGMSFLSLTGGSQLSVAAGAIVRATGNDSAAIDLSGPGNVVAINGLIEAGRAPQAPGQNSFALRSQAGSGTVTLSASGRINGNVALGGSYQVRVDGLVDGNVGLSGGAAVLSGGGVITGTVSGNGSVVPGSGVLTVGSYSAAGGVLQIDGGSAGNSGRLQVIGFPATAISLRLIDTTTIAGGGDGTARLDGGRLELMSQSGGDAIFTVLTAQQISGQFAEVDPPASRVGLALAYGPASVGVATVDPSLRDSIVRASDVAASGLLETISRHLRNLWAGAVDTTAATASMASGLLLASRSNDVRDFAALLANAAPQPTQAPASRVRVWADGFGGTEQDWPGGAADYGITSAGALIGADLAISPRATAGMALAYHHTESELSGNAARADTDAWFGSLYGSVAAGRALLDGAILLGNGETTAQRWLGTDGTTLSATGKPSDFRLAAAVNARAAFEAGWARLEPRIGLQYRGLWEGAYAEAGAGPYDLQYPASTFHALRAEATLTASRTVPVSLGTTAGTLVPELQAGIATDWALGSRTAEVVMTGFGDPFALKGDSATRTAALAGAAVALATGNLTLRVAYDGSFAGEAVAHRVTAGLSWRW